MIEISDGFTSISAGFDSIDDASVNPSHDVRSERLARPPTGARVTLDFRRQRALAPGQMVTVRYDFAGDGTLREGTGVAVAVQTLVRLGHAVLHHYRVSYWIPPAALGEFVLGNVRYRTEERDFASQPLDQQTLLIG